MRLEWSECILCYCRAQDNHRSERPALTAVCVNRSVQSADSAEKVLLMKSSEIRESFIEYFTARGHTEVESSPLVPLNDATLLFTNAGMVQFKETFLGLETRPYTRAVSAQRCIRAGGKHNDLENVGYTARHHTFFEMLGNFSFGDYFKREAIHYAYDFLTKVLQLPPEKLWVTVYTDDDEAADIWLKEVGVSKDRFSRCGEADNFWSMGETGPCGPCTEIFYDHGPSIPGGPPGSPEADGDRYIEIWNLVFMQYNRDKAGVLHPLPKPSVDTGMGLERIAAVVQQVHSNYEIDLFQYLIHAIAKLAPNIDPASPSLKVIADHIRACSFLIAEGMTPGNEGRGYVLRRIIRRAIRHGKKTGLPTPFFCRLVAPLVEVMGQSCPALLHSKHQIEKIIEQEELRFAQTLDSGLRLLQEQIKTLKTSVIPGEIAFKLYDTYGFPLDLTEDIAREQGLSVESEGFERAMQQQREQSQSTSTFKVDYSTTLYQDQKSEFSGYDVEQLKARILRLLEKNEKREKIEAPCKAEIILDKTPFYAESGGQVGDQGILKTRHGLFEVEDTQFMGEAIIHRGKLVEGFMHAGDSVEAIVNPQWRQSVRLNHTATHLLHAALKNILGNEVQQKGSLVHAKRARFDFSKSEAIRPEQLRAVENLVNEQIRRNLEVHTAVMSLEEARQSGAVALFGEKYSDKVRVLSMGDFSKEFCGGTHASRTGDIGLFKIAAEYGVAASVRRIEFFTGEEALTWVNHALDQLDTIASLFKVPAANLGEKLSRFVQEARDQEKQIIRLNEKLAANTGSDLLAEVQTVHGIKILIKQLNGESHLLRTVMDSLKSSLPDAVIVLYTSHANKLQVIAGVGKSLKGRVPSAVEFVKFLCGKGGGREDMAQGGSELPADLNQKVEDLKTLLVAP